MEEGFAAPAAVAVTGLSGQEGCGWLGAWRRRAGVCAGAHVVVKGGPRLAVKDVDFSLGTKKIRFVHIASRGQENERYEEQERDRKKRNGPEVRRQ